MPNQALRIGGYRYEHVEPLFDGRVSIEGVDAVFGSSPLVSDVFFNMAKGEYDVAEFGLTYFLRTFDTEESPFLALPIFPNRNFRHSAIFINTDSGIEKPEDLAGRTIGEFALYGHDPGVWVKGILSDEYGVRPESGRWVIGGTVATAATLVYHAISLWVPAIWGTSAFIVLQKTRKQPIILRNPSEELPTGPR
jgi:4,5-dihydroxyphthalate decarboxylase